MGGGGGGRVAWVAGVGRRREVGVGVVRCQAGVFGVQELSGRQHGCGTVVQGQ